MGPSGDRLGVMLGHLGPFWSDVVPVSGHVGAILGLYIDIWSRLGTIRDSIKRHTKSIEFSIIFAFWAPSESMFGDHRLVFLSSLKPKSLASGI